MEGREKGGEWWVASLLKRMAPTRAPTLAFPWHAPPARSPGGALRGDAFPRRPPALSLPLSCVLPLLFLCVPPLPSLPLPSSPPVLVASLLPFPLPCALRFQSSGRVSFFLRFSPRTCARLLLGAMRQWRILMCVYRHQ